jgi:hypothetical protein
VLAQQTGVVLANAQLHRRERERAGELLAAHRALLRSLEFAERMVIEHGTTVLAMELARRESLGRATPGCGPAWCPILSAVWTGRG